MQDACILPLPSPHDEVVLNDVQHDVELGEQHHAVAPHLQLLQQLVQHLHGGQGMQGAALEGIVLEVWMCVVVGYGRGRGSVERHSVGSVDVCGGWVRKEQC